jgi:hypothetical protein
MGYDALARAAGQFGGDTAAMGDRGQSWRIGSTGCSTKMDR